jgi:hypothetical protein
MAGSLGTAIPDKLREIHEMLVEDDDVETPDELVRPIESLLSSGLTSFGFLGRTMLTVRTLPSLSISALAEPRRVAFGGGQRQREVAGADISHGPRC